MKRYLLLFIPAAACSLFAQNGKLDPEFSRVPFDRWLTHSGETKLKWSASVSPAQLSVHQRLTAQIEALIDGVELAKRISKGRFVVFAQITDDAGNRYQNHTALNLEKMGEGIRDQNISCRISAFVLPGNYRVAVAVYNSAADEHAAKEIRFRADPIKDDPLRDSWSGLPPVEFVDAQEAPDSWFLPSVSGRLHLPVATQRPVNVDVVLNLTPSERYSGSTRAQERNLGRLIPALKDLSQLDLSNGSINFELLDLSRQRVTFHQEKAHAVDWSALKDSLSDAKPGVIDVKSLENRSQNAGFFVKEVGRKLERNQSGALHALIVLTSPVEFERGQELQPIEMNAPPDARVFYIRYHAAAGLNPRPGYPYGPMTRGPMRGGMGRGLPSPQTRPAVVDQLAKTLKPLDPRLFDVSTPEDFRKAMAAIMSDLSR